MSDLPQKASDFFKLCDGTLGDIPRTFKSIKFWRDNADLVAPYEQVIIALDSQQPLTKKLIAQGVEGDLDSHVDGKPMEMREQAAFALERTAYYLQPEVLASTLRSQTREDDRQILKALGPKLYSQATFNEGNIAAGGIESGRSTHHRAGRGGKGTRSI